MKKVYLYPGQLEVSAEPAEISTILGSCVAVALHDAKTRIGGLNHYLLPKAPTTDLKNPRYGSFSLTEMVDRMRRMGADPRRLKAKIYGGARVLGELSLGQSVGEMNIIFAHSALGQLGIPIVEEDTGGEVGRKIVLLTESFQVDHRLMREKVKAAAVARSIASGSHGPLKVVGVGGNVGAILSLFALIEKLPAEAPPVVVACTVSARGLGKDRLDFQGRDVAPVKSGERLLPGMIRLAGEGAWVRVVTGARGELISEVVPRPGGAGDSELPADFLFASLAKSCGRSCAAVLLGGIGDEGVASLQVLKRLGALTVVEDPKTAASSGLLEKAIQAGAAVEVLPVVQIPELLGGTPRRKAA